MKIESRVLPRRTVGVYVALSLLLAAWSVVRLSSALHTWRAGTPDSYPGQHRGLVLSAAGGLTLALVIPIPLLLGHVPAHRRAWRVALWAVWAVFMSATVVLLVLNLLGSRTA